MEEIKKKKVLGITELIAIALGGMIGGGIFTVLGISVALIGIYTPLAFIIGGLLAMLAAYSYIKLGVYYRDEGASYSFFKRTFPHSPFFASLIGWWVMFGYISTLALYAYTFAAYALSAFSLSNVEWIHTSVAGGIILLFTLINLWSVKGMGKIEDVMVYSKLVILVVISFVLINNANNSLSIRIARTDEVTIMSILIVASLTFVAFEGFQLVINAVNDMEKPTINIPKAIYTAVILASFIYALIAVGAILAIPFEDIVKNKEYALAAGADNILGKWGGELMIVGALLATCSAMSGTLYGASRQMSTIAQDGYFPSVLARKNRGIPSYSIIAMAGLAFLLILLGDLQLILEFGSITFLLVSLLISVANATIYKQTNSSLLIVLLASLALSMGMILILYYEAIHHIEQLYFIMGLYLVLTFAAWLYTQINQVTSLKR